MGFIVDKFSNTRSMFPHIKARKSVKFKEDEGLGDLRERSSQHEYLDNSDDKKGDQKRENHNLLE